MQITRHPWDRFVSAYRDKYIHICKRQLSCFTSVINLPMDSNKHADVATLKDVLVALMQVSLHRVNSHFKPMSALCEFGQIPYDFIGDLDTPAHMEYIASRIGARVLYSEYSNHTGLAEKYPAFACDIETVDLARALYGRDAALLGYSFDKAYESCGKHGKSSVE